jgi:hypothetical protein
MNGRDIRFLALGGLLAGVAAGAALVRPQAVTVPNTFQAGQVISSSQVNQNFAALASGINAVQANVDEVAGRFGGGISGSGTEHGGCFQGGFLGQVFLFAGNYPPSGALPADGRLLAISMNAALFSIFGTQYGGDGKTTFALPDLRGAAPHGDNGQAVSYFVCTIGIFPGRD